MSRHRKSDPRWRDEASAEVMAESVPQLTLGARVLLAGEAGPAVRAAITQAGGQSEVWLRRATQAGSTATEWPPDGPFTSALLRLPRAKDELDMMLHAVAARVDAGGDIAVYGANDEGIKSIAARMEPLLGTVDVVGQRAHCRVLRAKLPAGLTGLKAGLEQWRHTGTMTIAGTRRPWISYPGAFAKGGLDAGTGLLLAALAGEAAAGVPAVTIAPDARVLDYACGTGVIAAHVQAKVPTAQIVMADWDALAVHAAAQNVPAATAICAARLLDVPAAPGDAKAKAGGYDLIVSNPPIHDGKSEDYTVLGQLIAQAPEKLSPRGALVFVVQGRVPVEDWLAAAFDQVETVLQDTRYRVWCARSPKRKPEAGAKTRRFVKRGDAD